MADVQVDCVVVRAGWPGRLGSGVGSAREVSPQTDPCIARIVELVERRGRLPRLDGAHPSFEAAARFRQVPTAEAPLPLETWWPETTSPSRREPPAIEPEA